MRWYSIKKYMPRHDMGLCLVSTDGNGATHEYLARFSYDEVNDCMAWFHEDTFPSDNPIQGVTHFAIIEPLEIEE